MLLVVDIGNTNITVGVYKEDLLVHSWRIASEKKRTADEYGILLSNLVQHAGIKEKTEAAIIGSVVLPLKEAIKDAIESYLAIPVISVSSKINTGIELAVDKPQEVGADRIANACAAHHIYNIPCVVIDFGTATTFDIVSGDGKFVGGVISPGIGISAESLSSFTSLLPKLKIEAPCKAIGRNTIDAMLSGVVRGHAAMIDGLILSVEEEMNSPVTTIATGGYSRMITKYLRRPFDYIDDHLTLTGLKLIYELNKQ